MKRRLASGGVRGSAIACGIMLSGAWSLTGLAQDQGPRFRSSVDVTSVDVTVTDGDGMPVEDLTPDEFTVSIDGEPRQVLTAEWVPLGTPESDREPVPAGFSSNEGTLGGRLIVLVIDEPNIRFGALQPVQTALFDFIDQLPEGDRIAVVGLGPGGQSTPFTTNRQDVREAIGRMPGTKFVTLRNQYGVSVSEALDVFRGQPFVIDRIVQRECLGMTGAALQQCAGGVENDAISIATEATFDGRTTVDRLGGLLEALRSFDAPKTLLIVSEGFYLSDGILPLDELERQAAAAQTSIYALQLEDWGAGTGGPTRATFAIQDRSRAAEALSALASASRGSLFSISSSAARSLDRIEAELSGYYLLGLESSPADQSEGSRNLSVRVARKGLTVRSRRQLFGDSTPSRVQSPHEQIARAMTLPLVLPGLPLRVATFSLRSPDTSKVQLLIHADVGEDYISSRPVALGYVIADAEGRVVDSQAGDARLPPVMNGVPSPLQFTGGASLDPGVYTLKLAVMEGDRIGTIEHPVRAELTDAGEVLLSELTVGGPPGPSHLLQPTVSYTVSFGLIHGYMEVYGPRATETSVSFEIAAREDAPALLGGAVPPQVVSNDRVIFTNMMFARQLPPGVYVLRARVSMTAEGGPVEIDTLAREFEVAPPAVLLTSADSVVPPRPAGTELFLPVTEEDLRRPFHLDDLSLPQTLEAFRGLVAPSAVEAFDEGVSLLREGEYERAETTLKRAISVENNSAAPLTYLAAVFAASGHDSDAASVWQTALIEGSDRPEIYGWLGDALLRVGDYRQARVFLEEASEKWPADVRFMKPLALVYATFGQGREAVRTLKRHLDAHPEDVDALALGVEWIYLLHSAGYVAYSPAEDLETAYSWAEAHRVRGGADTALISQWVEFLEGHGR